MDAWGVAGVSSPDLPAGDLAVLCASNAFTVNRYTWIDDARTQKKIAMEEGRRRGGGGHKILTTTQKAYQVQGLLRVLVERRPRHARE